MVMIETVLRSYYHIFYSDNIKDPSISIVHA